MICSEALTSLPSNGNAVQDRRGGRTRKVVVETKHCTKRLTVRPDFRYECLNIRPLKLANALDNNTCFARDLKCGAPSRAVARRVGTASTSAAAQGLEVCGDTCTFCAREQKGYSRFQFLFEGGLSLTQIQKKILLHGRKEGFSLLWENECGLLPGGLQLDPETPRQPVDRLFLPFGRTIDE